jgi:ATP-dependent DNA helicase RecG
MPPTITDPLAWPVTVLPGVGPKRQQQLADGLGITTVGDLLLHRPRRYEDRRHWASICDLKLGDPAITRGRIVAQGVKRWRQGMRSLFEFVLEDGTGRLHCRMWGWERPGENFQVGVELVVFGQLVSLKPRLLDNPEIEVVTAGDEPSLHMDRIVPVYPTTEGLPQRWLRSLVWRALERFAGRVREPHPGVRPPGLPPRARALRQLHFPDELSDAEAARRRLALDEFVELQLAIQTRRRNLQAHATALPCAGNNSLIKPFLQRLGFSLTAAQTRVLREIRRDLGAAQPMRRLLQGDVGSGKTVVAACSALMAIESGFNVALMAPTEILAGQHHQNFQRWFGPLGVNVELQTGSRKTGPAARQRGTGTARAQPALFSPSPQAGTLWIGTHALIESGFQADRLGLVIIDEQHKFGVTQRETLVRKGRYPHLLVMTATPIPRTLGLTLYGDLDLSVIDEMPAGRGRVRTFLRGVEQLPKVHAFIRQKLAEGRQAFVVYPRVEEADPVAGVKAVTQEFARLEKTFAPHRVGLLHGRLRAEEKERVMAAFRANEVQVLLATSIIEVGVDAPNATVMLIENAGQFGLAQLHQLRGRIGRGAHESFCILMADLKPPAAAARLRVLAQTTDGFRIAEADLKLRGPGELLGQEQSGAPRFRFGNLAEDLALVEQARTLAAQILAAR